MYQGKRVDFDLGVEEDYNCYEEVECDELTPEPQCCIHGTDINEPCAACMSESQQSLVSILEDMSEELEIV